MSSATAVRHPCSVHDCPNPAYGGLGSCCRSHHRRLLALGSPLLKRCGRVMNGKQHGCGKTFEDASTRGALFCPRCRANLTGASCRRDGAERARKRIERRIAKFPPHVVVVDCFGRCGRVLETRKRGPGFHRPTPLPVAALRRDGHAWCRECADVVNHLQKILP